MIRLMLGNVGSGKTASMVREMYLDNSKNITYSNIITKSIKNNKTIDSSMIIKRTYDEKGKESLSLNKDFWMDINKQGKAINVIIDEAHAVLNPRRAMSKINVIMTEWMALIRRVLGGADGNYGELTLITQLDRRLDPIAREMATDIFYHVCHYTKRCKKCKSIKFENNEISDKLKQCPLCKSYEIEKFDHYIEVFRFKNIKAYEIWKETGQKSYFNHYFITDIEKYFRFYNTLQWDNLIGEY